RVRHGVLPEPPDEQQRIQMYLYARSALLHKGYTQTTPNCFVRESCYEQQHQRNAWSSLPLLGFGNSAYSFVDGCVTQNYRPVGVYVKNLGDRRLPVELACRLSAR